MNRDIEAAVAALGSGELTESALTEHVHPLFSRVLDRDETYLANHSLGRPLDQTARDVEEALTLWYRDMGAAWEGWLAERERFRANTAALIGAPRPDCVVPRASAGQGLRAVLNAFDNKIKVVTTGGEFDSVDLILKLYAARGRIDLITVSPGAKGEFSLEDIAGAVDRETTLVVVSMVMFESGQALDLAPLMSTCRAKNAMVLVDLYHAAGAIPLNVAALDCDFAIGGAYKYLRGGPGAAWLYIHPRHLNGAFTSLDTGWFAGAEPFSHERRARPRLAAGGDAFLESTPAVLPWFQARAGLEFTLAIGVPRLRAYSLKQQRLLLDLLGSAGAEGAREDRGAFLVLRHAHAQEWVRMLRAKKIIADARGMWLRLCPDILNTEKELRATARHLSEMWPR